MRHMITSRAAWLRGLGKAALAALLIVLVCFSSLAADNACLHHWLHTDHQSSSHECFITTFGKGQADIVAPSIVVFVPQTISFIEPPPPLLIRSARRHFLPDPRGPPALS